MKHSILALPFALAGFLPGLARASDPPAVLHLQARLSDAGGTPLQGPQSLQLKIYATALGGSALWSESETATALNGVVQLVLGDTSAIAPSLFDGSDRWLGITWAADPEMTPRLRIASAPYALLAGSVSKLDGTTLIPSGLITSTHLADGTIGSADFAPGAVTSAAIAPGSIGSAALLAGSVDSTKILDASIANADISAAAAIAGTKVAPNFGSQTISTLGLIGAGTASPTARIHALGGASVGLRADSASSNGIEASAHLGFLFPFVPPVAGVYGANDGGGDGLQGFTGGGGGAGVRGYTYTNTSYGGVFENGVGTALYSNGITGARCETGNASGDAVYARATSTTGAAWGVRAESASTSGIAVRADATAASGITYGVRGQSNSPAGYGGYFVNAALGVGAYVEGRAHGANSAALRVHNPETAQAQAAYFTNDSDYHTLVLENTGTGGTLWMRNAGSATFITAVDENGQWKFWVDKNGKTTTKVLQILGGSDLSEGFDIAAAPSAEGETQQSPEPGMVVSIDAEHEGRLLVSRRAYDHTLAGVISGAGGVQPGMIMGQRGSVADGEHPVALTGRVYVWCDASSAPIEPGDLLTSSDVAGHAMRAGDRERAQGAVLGKAMGRLASGRGLVLVLVNLQ